MRRTTPQDALHLARKKWLAGERLDVGKLAAELGIGRATMFRWVGTREGLYGEICSGLFAKELARATAASRGSGVKKLIDIMERLLRSLAAGQPLRRFVADDPEFALRVLTSRASQVQRRSITAIAELFAVLGLETSLPAEELAYIVVRITESFLYRDALTGDAADIEAAIRTLRILFTGAVKPKQLTARAGRKSHFK